MARRQKDPGAPTWPGMLNQLHHIDCRDLMEKIPDDVIDLVFADPPFNIGEDYDEYEDSLSAEEYLEWSSRWINEVYRVLDPCGSFWLAIGPKFVSELDIIAKAAGFYQRKHVIWYFTFGVNETKNFTTAHTHLIYYVKSKKHFTFNADQIRVPSARQLVYNDKRASPDGRLPDDTWIIRPQDVGEIPPDHSAQNFSRICGTFKEKRATANQVPEQLIARTVRACSNLGDTVFDPFGGSFTTAAVAKKLGRCWLSCDVSAAYYLQGKLRVDSVSRGDQLDGA